MTDVTDAALPAYTTDQVRNRLLAAGATGTIYAFVMPETEETLNQILDDRATLLGRYHEPWTRRQDAIHAQWFDVWFDWAAPIVKVDPEIFPHRYPTAGASEGIHKVMAEWASEVRERGGTPEVHVFEGEYEGFTAYARALRIPIVTHDRSRWEEATLLEGDAQFWLSQPSAIDGMVWPWFEAFARILARRSPQVRLVPDLSYVGAVAKPFQIVLDLPNVHEAVISQSKPFGVYYHRIGGVIAREEIGSLVGNAWFKNLQSLALGVALMRRHGVHQLATRYRSAQEIATAHIGRELGIEGLKATDVFMMATAPASSANDETKRSLLRGGDDERVLRLCVTPAMTLHVDGTMAPRLANDIGWESVR